MKPKTKIIIEPPPSAAEPSPPIDVGGRSSGRGPGVPAEVKAAIIAGWRAGRTIPDMALEHGQAYQTVGQIIARARKKDPSIQYRREHKTKTS